MAIDDFSKAVPVLEKLSRRLTKNPDMGVEPSHLEEVLNAMLDAAQELLDVDSASLWIKNDGKLQVAASRGLPDDYNELKLKIGEGITGKAVEKSETKKSTNLAKDSRRIYKKAKRKTKSMLVVPVCIGDEAVGAFNIYKKTKYNFNCHEENVLKLITNHAAGAILLAQRNEQARLNVIQVIHTLVSAFEVKTNWTYGHQERVMANFIRLASRLGLKPKIQHEGTHSARVHDIGKFGIPDSILDKKGKLNDEEWKQIRNHPQRGVEIVKKIKCIDYVIPGVLDHHERLDGSGYPNRKLAVDIDEIARIIGILDSWDAMMGRPYKPPMPKKIALYDLFKNAGLPYDKDLLSIYRTLERIRTSPDVPDAIRSKLEWETEGDVLRCADKLDSELLDKYVVKDDGPHERYDPEYVKAFEAVLKERHQLN
ncbi:GAF domain-containing protein [Candidatus Woesearchaeota archaeon]|nr:GAF domain-containing protein [Candidatus Woesearchaeota archaeon]